MAIEGQTLTCPTRGELLALQRLYRRTPSNPWFGRRRARLIAKGFVNADGVSLTPLGRLLAQVAEVLSP